MTGPLGGVRVLDLTTIMLGPWATQILGDMGADVIKIESPDGDAVRGIGPARNPGMSAVFLNANRNKRSVVLDLKQPRARRALLRLAEGADVFVHNMRPAAIERLGLAYAALAAANPGIVYCATYGYGKAGPHGHRAAYDDLIQGACGLAGLVGRNAGAPAYVPTVMADKTVSLAVVGSIAMALFHRARSGEGQEIEVPMYETMVAFTMVEHLFGRTFVPPLGPAGYPRTLSPRRVPYRTRDGYVGVLPYTDKQWQAFIEILGRPDMAADERFQTMASRLANVDAVYAEVGAEMTSRTTAEWLEALDGAGIPASPINDIDDLMDEPHLEAVGFWRTVEHPSEGTLRTADVFSRFSRTPGDAAGIAPRHGEHTREVLEECGLGADEITAMCAAGAALQAEGG